MAAVSFTWVHDGNIWFADPQARRIARVSPATGAITYFEPVGQDQFAGLHAISSASDGDLYFTGVRSEVNGINFGVGKVPLWVPEHTAGTNIYPTHGTLFDRW